MSEEKEKSSHTGIIAGLSAALAAGAVYFYGPDGEERRKNIRGWILKTKGEVLDKLEEAESITKETYEEIVDKAVEKFATERAKKESEIEIIRDELKSSWENIAATVEKHGDDLRTAAADEITKRRKKISDRIASNDK